MSEVSGKVRELEWTADHGVAGLGPYRLFEAITPLGRFTYGTDAEGSSWWSFQHGGIFTVGDEAAAKRQAEASWAKMAIAECAKCIVPSPAPDVNGAFKGPVDTDDALMMAAREAGWALMELVDGIDWPKREHVARIITTLGDAIASAEASRSPDTAVMGEVEKVLERIPGALNAAFQGGTEEREGGSARRQERVMQPVEDLRTDAADLLSRIRSMKEPSDADAK